MFIFIKYVLKMFNNEKVVVVVDFIYLILFKFVIFIFWGEKYLEFGLLVIFFFFRGCLVGWLDGMFIGMSYCFRIYVIIKYIYVFVGIFFCVVLDFIRLNDSLV